MSLTDADVQYVATLARLGLSQDEVSTLRNELSSILEHIAVLQQLDTSTISPTAQVNDLSNVMREDMVVASLSQDQVLANAPQSRDGFFEVRAVLGEEEGASA
ncbi:MAG TPA: Asp-tRNA(Asn)/Glu-tRNA(Gln) amidotransferase subunit GatC [Thermomicrobiales bacterium]|nr:Asp-tRNA(Asn)/Glu-tRNA(Gln) amidotransferase subunit GatC [Thermomicrobiales bacterium]